MTQLEFYLDFYKRWLGRWVNKDGYYGAQCWDGAVQYEDEICGHITHTDIHGYACDIWESRKTNGILKNFIEVEIMQPGDIAVFKKTPGWTPDSHIAIFHSDIDGKYGWFFGQNQGGAPAPGGGACFNLCKFPYSATFPTAFRPKKFLNDFNEKDLIAEKGIATLTVDQVAIRKGNPINGTILKRVNTKYSQQYSHKWIGNGHRYVAWKEKNTWYFMAVGGSETQGKEPWATFKEVEEKPSYKIESETYAIRLKVDGVRIRKEPSTSAEVVGTLNTGDEREYVAKTVNDGHRWVQLKDKNWVGITPKEERSEEWVALIDPKDMAVNKPKPDKPAEPEEPVEPSKPDNTKNVKAYGIDISTHNGDYDVSGNEFVIIRACFGTNTDDKFLQNVKKCQATNIPFGVYCYDYALDDAQALEEAEYMVKLLQDNNIVPSVGVWFDMEDADGYKNKHGVLNKERCTNSCRIFCDYLKDKGYFVGVYSSEYWFENYVDTDYPKWMASWGTNDGTLQKDFSDDDQVYLYQYTSVPLDKNVSYKDFNVFVSNPKPIEPPKPDEPEKPSFPNMDIDALNNFIRNFANLDIDTMNEFFESQTEINNRVLGK